MGTGQSKKQQMFWTGGSKLITLTTAVWKIGSGTNMMLWRYVGWIYFGFLVNETRYFILSPVAHIVMMGACVWFHFQSVLFFIFAVETDGEGAQL